jgi:hypothetical protein
VLTPEFVDRLRQRLSSPDLTETDDGISPEVKATLAGTRSRRDGTMEDVRVEICQDEREYWYVTATNAAGRLALGNPERTLAVAIETTQFHKLDHD